jgi:hypothetical protein
MRFCSGGTDQDKVCQRAMGEGRTQFARVRAVWVRRSLFAYLA